jgi:WD40 repeat protein
VLVLDGEPQLCSIAFTADGDGSRLVAVRQYQRVEVWSPFGGEQLYALGPFYPSQSMRYTASVAIATPARGPFLFVAAEGPPSAFDVVNGQLVGTASTDAVIRHVKASADGKWLIAADDVGGDTRLYGFRCTASGAIQSVWETRAPYSETLCAFVGTGERFVTSRGGLIIVRDSATGQELTEVNDPSMPHWCAEVSFDGNRFGVGASKLYIWDTAKWDKPAAIRSDSGQPFVSFAFHPTRPILAAIQRGQTLVKFLDAATGGVVSKFQWKLGEMCSVCFSPDGTLAAASSASGKIVVWDVDE